MEEKLIRIEVDEKGRLDEVVTDGSAHFEMLTNGSAFLRLGPLAMIVHAQKNGRLRVVPRDGEDFSNVDKLIEEGGYAGRPRS